MSITEVARAWLPPWRPPILNSQKGLRGLPSNLPLEQEPFIPLKLSQEACWAGLIERIYFGAQAPSNVQKSVGARWGGGQETRRWRPSRKPVPKPVWLHAFQAVPPPFRRGLRWLRCAQVPWTLPKPQASQRPVRRSPPSGNCAGGEGSRGSLPRAGKYRPRAYPNLRGLGSSAPGAAERQHSRTRAGHRRSGGRERLEGPGPR